VLWDRTRRLIDRWLPPARTCHPYPLRRMGVITCGKSRMRQSRLSGSVEGVMGNHDSYSDMRSVNRKTDLLSGGFDQARVRAVNDDHV
jgi:hypothetical protein